MNDSHDSKRVQSGRLVTYAAISGATGILAGTFAAHALPHYCDWRGFTDIARRADLIETAVRYHLVHAIALLALASLVWLPTQTRAWVGRLFVFGLICFSGGLYLLAATELRIIRFVPPLGGTAWIVGWLLLLRTGRNESPR